MHISLFVLNNKYINIHTYKYTCIYAHKHIHTYARIYSCISSLHFVIAFRFKIKRAKVIFEITVENRFLSLIKQRSIRIERPLITKPWLGSSSKASNWTETRQMLGLFDLQLKARCPLLILVTVVHAQELTAVK